MDVRRLANWKVAVPMALAAAAVGVGGFMVMSGGSDDDVEVATGAECRPSTVQPGIPQVMQPQPGVRQAVPEIDCAAPPNTFDGTMYFATGQPAANTLLAGPTFDSWAWSTFAAMNWPVLVDGSQPTGFLRGVPGTAANGQSTSFATAQYDDTTVWETFKEKREVFYPTDTSAADTPLVDWQMLTFAGQQDIGGTSGLPACTPDDEARVAELDSNHRRHMQASKLPAINESNTGDETAEVASPAQESPDVLCANFQGQGPCPFAQAGSGTNGEYTPTETNDRPAVGPRVFDAATGNIVYFEVKLNYDYYEFVTNPPNLPGKGPWPSGLPADGSPPGPYTIDANAALTARAAMADGLTGTNMALPYRTSAPASVSGLTDPTNESFRSRQSTLGYEAAAVATMYGTSPATPPPIGSVQIKAGWKLLTAGDPSNESYHVTEGIYFSSQEAPTTPICYKAGTFGLIGLHIIQRVHLGDSTVGSSAQPTGGTYILATWEHTSIGDGSGYRYANYLAPDPGDPPRAFPDLGNPPAVDKAIQVRRDTKYNYPLASTRAVNQAVWDQLPPDSVWRNYQLIGTQFLLVNSETDSLTYNQPYYLANLVIETSQGLQNFQGLPPGVDPVLPGFKDTATLPGAFEPTFSNVRFSGMPMNMGGCMGCHGVAQVNGYNFSFVLQDGQEGANIDTPAHFEIPPDPPPNLTTTTGG